MAAKRSPILGYNHNVRFRGIVFHIQTEDSGIVNPHVFSHLFHGGVILSTRKLVYDAGSNEDAVKSLMQAQHKAVMKDLRRGAFDDKIDSYLADAPGLLPRESIQLANAARATEEAAAEVAAEQAAADAVAALASEVTGETAVPDLGPPVPRDVFTDEPSAPAIELIEPEDSSPIVLIAPPLPPGLESTEPVPIITFEAARSAMHDDPSIELELGSAKPAAFLVEDDDLYDATPVPELARAPTERSVGSTVELELEADPLPEPLVHPPSPPPTRTEISAALSAIQVSDEELAAALAIDDDVPVEIHSPALPSAPQPPGAAPERVGEYHLARKSTVVEAPPAPARPPIPRPTPVASRVPTPSSGRPPIMPSARPPTVPGNRTPTPPPGNRVPTPMPTPPRSSTFRSQSPPPPDPGRSRAPTPSHTAPSSLTRPTPQSTAPRAMPSPTPSPTPVSSRPPIAPPRRPATGGGVVVSRPAVIVGGKSATTPPPKVRRAKEAESFGGDLISERSLDEVILAYLSEDNSED